MYFYLFFFIYYYFSSILSLVSFLFNDDIIILYIYTIMSCKKNALASHNKNINLNLYEKINGMKDIAIKNNNNFIQEFNTNFNLFNSDIVINSNIFSDTPKLLSASFTVSAVKPVRLLPKTH